jgi:hypothetical protein
MSHKAYAFDWSSFERDELHGILLDSLSTGDPAGLIRYIDAHLDDLKDPYEGDQLDEDWRKMLENRDVHEYGDFALTRFYDPAEDGGIADQWRVIDKWLAEADQEAFLGTPLGQAGAYFDPGRQGSYFQTPRQVVNSLARARRFKLPDLQDYQRESLERFKGLLAECVETESGLYVTF